MLTGTLTCMDDDTSDRWLRPLPEYEPPAEVSGGELDQDDTAAAVIALDEEGEL